MKSATGWTYADAVTSDFFIKRAYLDDVSADDRVISIRYLLDDEPTELKVVYGDISLNDRQLQSKPSDDALQTFAVSLGVLSFMRFASVLPVSLDIRKYSRWIDPELVTFLRKVLPRAWSEHRYQVGRMDYRTPEILYVGSQLGSRSNWPIWKGREIQGLKVPKVAIAFGGGKDSLLCTQLLEYAGLEYDLMTYVYDVYGDEEMQVTLFSNVTRSLQCRNKHLVYMHDDYFPWVSARLDRHNVLNHVGSNGPRKPFRTEAGEVFFGALCFFPVQVVYNIELQLVGNEKSADAPNLVDDATSEPVAHQWEKSLQGEWALHELFRKMFVRMNRVSLTKPIHDVMIFKTLFRLAGDLPYLTSSCNTRKPWCCACEKCAYVFAGFSAYGNHQKVVSVFGEDLFRKSELLPIWRQLLGIEGYIPWECVGQPEEAQLYLYKALKAGIEGKAIDLLCQELLPRTRGKRAKEERLGDHFRAIEAHYSKISAGHHLMPDWLWQRVREVLLKGNSNES